VLLRVCEQREKLQCCFDRDGSGARVCLPASARAGAYWRGRVLIHALQLIAEENPKSLPTRLDSLTASHAPQVPVFRNRSQSLQTPLSLTAPRCRFSVLRRTPSLGVFTCRRTRTDGSGVRTKRQAHHVPITGECISAAT